MTGAHSSHIDDTQLPGPAPHTAGPHNKDWMNKLDPFVDSHPYSATTDEDILALPVHTGEGTYSEATIDQKGRHLPRGDGAFAADSSSGHTSSLPHHGVGSEATTDRKSHHMSRDAAVAAGVGGAAYEADKHHKHDKISSSLREMQRGNTSTN
jgi:hypothetical protein